ncbi:MAG TPA: zf-HC2 domain-containing protein, partial [Candidatus Acidoferrales bacterium]|nr:zf-HC2 domain-containing protein [Candidatus Acidoferrales bacterium]
GMRPHDEFLELCAVSTSGELSKEEQKRLKEHLAVCPECRQALKEFEAVVDVGVPLLSSELSGLLPELPGAVSADAPEALILTRARSEAAGDRTNPGAAEQKMSLHLSHPNGRQRTQLNWNLVWLPFAAAILLTIALGIFAYRIGSEHAREVAQTTANSSDQRLDALEQQISDADHARDFLTAELAQREQSISDLWRQIAGQSAALGEMKTVQATLEQSNQANASDKQQMAERNATLAQQLSAAQASLDKTQTELEAVRQQQSQGQVQVAGLESQIDDLSGRLRRREETIDRQDALLAHDRDIRELMGARDLYIAEVYDVGRDGKTEKPFGRVFYTKGKSLVFYAYDLDQQDRIKSASTFQAWGRRGADQQQALNLGIFYQDNAAKKRWVVKFDNAKQLTEIDAVFVTVEPKGGSPEPSGKPLLFAYLKINPNHP